MTTQEIREKAAQLVEKGWTRNAYARDVGGRECSSLDPSAVCWCLAGALKRVTGTNYSRFDLEGQIEMELGLAGGGDSVRTWQDAPERTQAEVVAALRGQP